MTSLPCYTSPSETVEEKEVIEDETKKKEVSIKVVDVIEGKKRKSKDDGESVKKRRKTNNTGDKIIYSVYSTSKKKFEAQVCC